MRNQMPRTKQNRRNAARLFAASLLLPLGACASDGWLASLGLSGPAPGEGEVTVDSSA